MIRSSIQNAKPKMPNCITCTDLVLKEAIGKWRHIHFELEELVASVGTGCPGCKIIHDGILARRGTLQDITSVALNLFDTAQPLHVSAFQENGGCEVMQFYTLAGKWSDISSSELI
jgi:hypothetical protein